jgi:glycosyltransferase involved in cell wall biosynthesis
VNSPKLSVVVSSYNQRNYIIDCLEAIVSQDIDVPYEVVISDDGSKDGTREMIDEFALKYPDLIRVLPNESNVGPARNYFRAHNAARGAYVAHIDGDDIMLPGKLKAQVAVLEANPDCVLVIHRARYFNDSRSYVTETGELPSGNELTFYSIEENARWGTIAVHSSYMYRASARKTREYQADFMEWYFTMEYLVEPGTRACFINRVLVEYRCNDSNSAYTASRKGRQRSYRIHIGHLMDNFKAHPALRRDIYAHAFLNILTYFRAVKTLESGMIWFLVRNFGCFDLTRVKDVMRVRQAVAPRERIR